MRILLTLVLAVAIASAGCSHQPPPRWPNLVPEPGRTGTNITSGQNLLTTQQLLLVGKVMTVNPSARFVVLNFPLASMPVVGQRLSVYRQGLKVGEVRVTGPQRDDKIVADITAGDATVGDEVREK